MDRWTPIDRGYVVPIGEPDNGNPMLALQKTLARTLGASGVDVNTALNAIVAAALSLIASRADTSEAAQEAMRLMARCFEKYAPTAAQMHFEVHQGGV